MSVILCRMCGESYSPPYHDCPVVDRFLEENSELMDMLSLQEEIDKIRAEIKAFYKLEEAAKNLITDHDCAPVTGGYTTKELRDALSELDRIRGKK